MVTIPEASFEPHQPNDSIDYLRGQVEVAPTTGYRHWQIIVHFRTRKTLTAAKGFFHQSAHLDAVRSLDDALAYCHKDETAVVETRFEFGVRPMRANSAVDWGLIFDQAREGIYDDIPAHIKVRNFSSLLRITSVYDVPPLRENVETIVFWGVTGSGAFIYLSD
jgi:hypothetical protein